MPPERTTKPFKPHRPSIGAASSTTSSKRAPGSSSATSNAPSSRAAAASASKSTRPAPSARDRTPPPPNPNPNPNPRADDPDDAPTATIPPALLATLLHRFFADDKMRVSRGADRAVGKYMDTFVREAIARAAFERAETERRVGGGDGFLEVEDLERVGVQVVLDF